ncbi:hypothetical protein AK830_g2304 [Neonectria ditissima]|uniref:Uncharacterized protein n=1 Tax=Neonectria ditissima TaxID=78410 RepID=A0A0P7BWH2_9HYPO|nr:hypothetical protein AK830_g2304 [Neonectria ditissima]
MAVFKMNALASVMALVGVFASASVATASYSDCSSTLPIVTQEYGSTTSDGTALYTWSVCTVVHNTQCEVASSIDTAVPSVPTAATVPGPGGLSSYGEGEHYTSVHGENQPSLSVSVPQGSVPAGGSQPGYSVPASGATTGTGEGSQPSVTGETVTGATHASGHSSSVYPVPSDGTSGSASDSYTGTETNPTATGDEATSSGASGTPTATGAATMLDPVSAAILGVAGMVAAIIL